MLNYFAVLAISFLGVACLTSVILNAYFQNDFNNITVTMEMNNTNNDDIMLMWMRCIFAITVLYFYIVDFIFWNLRNQCILVMCTI